MKNYQRFLNSEVHLLYREKKYLVTSVQNLTLNGYQSSSFHSPIVLISAYTSLLKRKLFFFILFLKCHGVILQHTSGQHIVFYSPFQFFLDLRVQVRNLPRPLIASLTASNSRQEFGVVVTIDVQCSFFALAFKETKTTGSKKGGPNNCNTWSKLLCRTEGRKKEKERRKKKGSRKGRKR